MVRKKAKKVTKSKATPSQTCCTSNVYVQLAGTVGGITLIMVLFNLLFAPMYAWISIFIVLIMCIFGTILGTYYKNSKK